MKINPLTSDRPTGAHNLTNSETFPVVDPGFPLGGVDLVGGREFLRRLRFKNFVCQNERIWALGGMHQARPLDTPMLPIWSKIP